MNSRTHDHSFLQPYSQHPVLKSRHFNVPSRLLGMYVCFYIIVQAFVFLHNIDVHFTTFRDTFLSEEELLQVH